MVLYIGFWFLCVRDITWAFYQAFYQICKIAGCAYAGNARNVFPRHH